MKTPPNPEQYVYARSKRAADVQRLRAARLGQSRHFTADEFYAVQMHYAMRCVRCGCFDWDLVVDHIVPFERGGSNGIENIQPLCNSCNIGKGSRTIDFREQSCVLTTLNAKARTEHRRQYLANWYQTKRNQGIMKKDLTEENQELTAQEAARLLDISYATFMRRVHGGVIAPIKPMNPALRKQRGMRFRRGDVAALAQRK